MNGKKVLACLVVGLSSTGVQADEGIKLPIVPVETVSPIAVPQELPRTGSLTMSDPAIAPEARARSNHVGGRAQIDRSRIVGHAGRESRGVVGNAATSSALPWEDSRGLLRPATVRDAWRIRGSCGDPTTGDCCEANGTPYCDNAECCMAVCEYMPYCCDEAGEGWDDFCAMAAWEDPNCSCGGGGGCGDPTTGNCCEANWTPYCDNAECCMAVCGYMPYCCDEAGEGWDDFCAMAAWEDPNCTCGGGGGCGDPTTGDCCEANWTPYCDNTECCMAICEYMPYCCDEAGEGWDDFCAMAAWEDPNCTCGGGGGCGDPTTGDCCEANGTPYCDNAECCMAICEYMPYCCDEAGEGWDDFCAMAAWEDPNCACGSAIGACCDPTTGNCSDDVDSTECLPPLQFSPGMICEGLDPPCGNPGACCDDAVALCQENIFQVFCEGTRFLGGGICEDFNPPCGAGGGYTITFLDPPTAPPPAGLGGCEMSSFAVDPRPIYEDVESVPSPCPVGGDVLFSLPMNHRRVPDSWFTWSHGYEGDVYYSNFGSEITLTLPPGSCGFYFYVEPAEFAVFEFRVTVNETVMSEPFPVDGNAGAVFVGVSGEGLDTIRVTCFDDNAGGFAVGEFGICCTCDPVFGACCDPFTSECNDEVEGTACLPPLGFYYSQQCEGLDPPCGNPGACCNPLTGECQDNVPELACSEAFRFEAGTSCEMLDPPCGGAPGCCCVETSGTVSEGLEAACQAMGGRFLAGVVGEECTANAFDPPCGEWACQDGILYAPSQDDNAPWRARVSALAGCPVDYWDARSATPTIQDLQGYCAVFTWADHPYANNQAFGDVLAQFVDYGGKVILGQWTYPAAQSVALAGRIITPEYCPVTVEDYYFAQYLSDGTDCAWCGVQRLGGGGAPLDRCVLADGAESDGTFFYGPGEMYYPALAWRADRGVFYSPGNTGGHYVAGDTAQLVANIYRCNGPEAIGACCDPQTGICLDATACADCPRDSRVHANMNCTQLNPPCGNPGCCCNEDTGEASLGWEASCPGRFISGIPEEECTAAVFDPPCGQYDGCPHTLTMWDDEGDGWDGCFLDLYVNGQVVFEELYLEYGPGPEGVTFNAVTGDQIVADYFTGGAARQSSYCIYDGLGYELGCDGLSFSEPVGITVLAGCEEPVCGDDLCAAAENCCNCPEDCGAFDCLTQTANAANAVFSDLDCAACDNWQQVLAEDFTVCPDDQQEIDMLGFRGVYFPENLGATDLDAFTVVIRSDNEEGLPGTVMASYGPMPATTKEATGTVLYGLDEYEYTIELDPSVTLGEGTYWIEMYNWTSESEGSWAWETGTLDGCAGRFNCARLLSSEPEELWAPLEPANDLALALICTAGCLSDEDCTDGDPCNGTETCEHGTCVTTLTDCNENQIDDICDVAAGTSEDCNANGIPDECEIDSDGDRVIDDCDGCPFDVNKVTPGICGCGVPDQGDGDGDGVLDCVDICPGVDDGVFAPQCVGAIPTMSGWGIIIMALLLLVGSKVYFGHRRPESLPT